VVASDTRSIFGDLSTGTEREKRPRCIAAAQGFMEWKRIVEAGNEVRSNGVTISRCTE